MSSRDNASSASLSNPEDGFRVSKAFFQAKIHNLTITEGIEAFTSEEYRIAYHGAESALFNTPVVQKWSKITGICKLPEGRSFKLIGTDTFFSDVSFFLVSDQSITRRWANYRDNHALNKSRVDNLDDRQRFDLDMKIKSLDSCNPSVILYETVSGFGIECMVPETFLQRTIEQIRFFPKSTIAIEVNWVDALVDSKFYETTWGLRRYGEAWEELYGHLTSAAISAPQE